MLLKEGFVGVKTGWTDMAGLTFIGLNQDNNREIITIVNKSKVDEKKYSHFYDSKLLYKTSIETFNNYKIINKNDNIYILRNSYFTEKYKSEFEWIEFINLTENNSIILSDYDDKNIILSFNKYKKSFKITNNKKNIKWDFNPLKLFEIIANQ